MSPGLLEMLFPERAFQVHHVEGVAAVAAKVLVSPDVFDLIILERQPANEVEAGALRVLLADAVHPPVGVLAGAPSCLRHLDVVCGVGTVAGKMVLQVCAFGERMPKVCRHKPEGEVVIEYRRGPFPSMPELHVRGGWPQELR